MKKNLITLFALLFFAFSTLAQSDTLSRVSALQKAEYSFRGGKVYFIPVIGIQKDFVPYSLGMEIGLSKYLGLGLGIGRSRVAYYYNYSYTKTLSHYETVANTAISLNFHFSQIFQSKMIDIVPGIGWVHSFASPEEFNILAGSVEFRLYPGPHVGIVAGPSFGISSATDLGWGIGLIFK
ncbi:hypothetical protein ABID42_004194 [Arcicella rosea]|uniref:hypothetical protein n=1 Tax=Arcicella rosea TaxID=502909 RepID=UPI00345D3288